MKIPEKLKIGGHEVKIIPNYRFTQNSDLCGQTDYYQNEIRLSDIDQSGTPRAESPVSECFLHEIIHWVCHTYCGQVQLEEKVLTALSEGLFQVLRDNKLHFDEV